LQQIGAARPVGPTIDRYPSPQPPLSLTLRASRIERVLGMRVPDADVPARLEPLGFTLSDDRGPIGDGRCADSDPGTPMADSPSAEGTHIDHRPSTIDHRWTVTVPSFRVDVQREIDLIEEIARHDGYAGLPATFPKLTDAQAAPDVRSLRDRLVRQVLTGCGPSEARTFSFIQAHPAPP